MNMRKAIAEALKDLGVREVIIEGGGDYIVTVEFSGDTFRERFTNKDFSEEGL